MARWKVYVTDYDYDNLDLEKSILEPIGAEVIGLQCKTGEGLAELAKDADIIMARYAKITRETLEQLERCKAICRYGIGVDTVDVKAVYDNGMILTNIPDFCIEEVAEHSIAMGLTLLRRLPMYDQATKAGSWRWQDAGGPIQRFRDMTWGIIGFGKIGQNIALKIKGLGFKVVCNDPFISQNYINSFGVEKVAFSDLIRSADLVNVMCPYNKSTHHIIDQAALKEMKPTSVVINCSRGKLVDNQALYQALKEGWIAAAGLDDTEDEPAKNINWQPRDNPLFSLDNCLISPHAAYYSEASLEDNRRLAAENAKAVLLGTRPINIVRPLIGGGAQDC
ncbi:MAG: C-terminal binding protein [Halanaerobiales bacterium]|nr:C-terminal binding protein [Halanaerobiales bacterium]